MSDRQLMPEQLSLPVHLKDEASFDNFHVPDSHINALAVRALQQQLLPFGEQFIFLSGVRGSGVTHLLNAACHAARQVGLTCQYVALDDASDGDAYSVLEPLELFDLVCLDNVQAAAGKPDWEQALFGFFNVMRDSGRRVVMGADLGPRELPVALQDLKSRLNSGLVLQLQPLTDDDKRQVLQLRARARGIELSDEVAEFIMRRAPRNTQSLFAMLQKLDDASLAQRRRLTIPFVKETLGY